jgi:hypothetical protein
MAHDMIQPVTEGATVTIDRRDMTVQPTCHDSNAGQWYCTTHDAGFANQIQKDIHIHTGRHTMAWICFSHGPEVP